MQRIEELYDKYLHDTISDVERQELQELIKNADDSQLARLANSYLDADAPDNLHDLQPHTDELLQRIKRCIAPVPQEPHTSKKIFPLWKWLAAVSGLVVIFSIGYYYQTRVESQPQELISEYGDDVLPGTNRATITLSNGKTINLDEQQIGLVSTADGLSYEDGSMIETVEAVQYATLSTPRGGQYKVTLSDGTVVWLNAGSSLEYPVRFVGNERQVKLTGEGYFEVSPDATKPFIVATKNQQVQVLGTAFNVRAYADTEITTLVSGKVAIGQAKSSPQEQLVPGQQATIHQGAVTIKQVDVSEYTAWKDGMIVGSPIDLMEVVAEVARWYDVDFIYPAVHSNFERAYISIDRKEKLSSVLKALEHTYGVTFQIKGKEVYIRIK